jgi:hypothetical protein
MKKSRVKRLLRHEVLENRQLLAASGLGAGEPGDEFLLTDVNPTSTTFNQQVSPQAFDGQTSVWYFTHTT